METKQIINGLLDKADRVADQSAGRIMRQAADRLKELDQAQKWIPVTERLPESERQAVLIALCWGEVDIGWCENEIWGSEFVNEYEYGEVTHWIPLPKPPKEDE